MLQLSETAFKKLAIAMALYLTSLLAANTLGLKIMPFLFGTHLSAGVFMFPIVFIMTDVVGELYGKKVARFFVLAGFISTALFILYSIISLAVPWAEAGLWAKESYNTIFAVSLRISIASLIAYAVGEYQDVFMFFFFKKIWGEKYFWLRSNLSNLWSQLLDTILFMTIAFYGVYDTKVLLSIMLTWWLFKVLMGVAYTPLAYAGLWLLREPESRNAGQGN